MSYHIFLFVFLCTGNFLCFLTFKQSHDQKCTNVARYRVRSLGEITILDDVFSGGVSGGLQSGVDLQAQEKESGLCSYAYFIRVHFATPKKWSLSESGGLYATNVCVMDSFTSSKRKNIFSI